jgi:hypothetical protein
MSTDTPESDPVAGLLAAIEQHQKDALSISAGRFVEGMAGRQVDPELSRYLDTVADPDAVIRLCRAHRNIIGLYEAAAKRPDELMAQRAHGVDVLTAQATAEALKLAVEDLAEGYGLREENSDERA